jgi:DNA mismatch repair protein MLH1
LDAGSTFITITVVDGGYKSFTIQDNGHGILKEDLALLCERYATSKLQNIEDLRQLDTFGFRGEALASISHIGRITVITRTASTSVGFKASYIDGRLVGEATPLAANIGTTITVQDLFYNNPVRSASTGRNEEYLCILNMVQRYAIERAGRCSLTLRKGGSNDLLTRLEQTPLEVIRTIYNERVASALVPLNVSDLATGLISSAYYQQKAFTFILFINGRLVDSPRLKRSIASVYSEVLLKQTHPFVYLSLRIPPARLDVNIHPTKREVIFLDEDRVISEIITGLKAKLGETGVVKTFVPTLKVPVTVPEPVIKNIHQVRPSTLNPQKPLYPFQQVHNDHKSRTLDFFVHKKMRTETDRAQIEIGDRANRDFIVAGKMADQSGNQSGDQSGNQSGDQSGDQTDRNTAQTDRNTAQTDRNTAQTDRNTAQTTGPNGNQTDRNTAQTAQTTAQTDRADPIQNGNPFLVHHLQPPPEILANGAKEPASLTSISELRQESNRVADKLVAEIMKKHTFVGQLDNQRVFIQFETCLIMVDIPRLVVEWVYLDLLCNYNRLKVTNLPQAAPMEDCIRKYLQVEPQVIKGNQIQGDVLLKEIVQFVNDHVGVFREFLHIKIDDSSIIALPDYFDTLSRLPERQLGEFFFKAVIDCDWEDEKSCVQSLFRLYAELIAVSLFTEKSHLEHVVLPALRRPAADYPTIIAKNGTITRIATTHELYKIFERC